MNIQDISDFLDLVKNPDKYEAALKTIKDEQARLDGLVAAVGKVTELDQLQKKLNKQLAIQEQLFADQTQKLQADYTAKLNAADLAKKKATDKANAADKAILKAEQDSQLAASTVKSYADREKVIQYREQATAESQANLQKLIAEYEEKVAKLRAVMV